MDNEEFSQQVESLQLYLGSIMVTAGEMGENLEERLSLTFEKLQTSMEELQVAEEELRQQNEELMSTRSDLERERQRYQHLFEFAPIGYLVTDEFGVILEANRVAAQILNVSASYLVGKSIGNFIPGGERRQFRNRLNELRKNDESQVQKDFEIQLRPRHEPIVTLAVRILRMSESVPIGEIYFTDVGPAQLTFRWLLRDISREKQMESDLAEMEQQLLDQNESERMRLAQDLHDGAIQDLYGVAFQLKAIQEQASDPQQATSLSSSHRSVQQVINQLRVICGELRPPTLAPFGLEKAIRSHAQRFQELHPEIELELDLDSDGKTLPERVRLALFRIYQHALTNVLRHAHAHHVQVSFKIQPERLILDIQDDGQGFQVPKRWISLARSGHFGLAGAAERAWSIGGVLRIDSAPGSPTHVQVIVPRLENYPPNLGERQSGKISQWAE